MIYFCHSRCNFYIISNGDESEPGLNQTNKTLMIMSMANFISVILINAWIFRYYTEYLDLYTLTMVLFIGMTICYIINIIYYLRQMFNFGAITNIYSTLLVIISGDGFHTLKYYNNEVHKVLQYINILQVR